MPGRDIDRILDNLLHVLPVFHKKVTRLGFGGVTGDLTPPQLAIMRMLGDGSLTATELANRLAAKKPQMTLLVAQLVRMNVWNGTRTPMTAGLSTWPCQSSATRASAK